ncbi:unnamed protein product [Closterium sp. NIES-54]
MLSVVPLTRIMADDHKLKAPVRAISPDNLVEYFVATSTTAAFPEAMPQVPADQATAAHGGDRTQAESIKLALNLNSRHHPQLLLQLDRLQQEIEARGGHAVLEIVPAAAGTTNAAAAASGATAAACTTPCGGSPSTLPPKSPGLSWKGQWLSQRPRQLVRPLSVPARLDSMLNRFMGRDDSFCQFGSGIYPAASQSSSAAPPSIRIESPPSSQEISPSSNSGDSEPETAGAAPNAGECGASGSDAVSPSPPSRAAVAYNPKRGVDISARWRLNGRPFRSSSNLDLPDMDCYSIYEDTNTTTTNTGTCSKLTTVAASSAAIASSPPAPLPELPAPRRYAHHVLVQSQDFKFVRGPQRTSQPPPGDVTSPCEEHDDEVNPRCSSTFRNLENTRSHLKQRYQYPTMMLGELERGAAQRVSHRSVKSLGGDYNMCDLTSYNGFMGSTDNKKLAGAVDWRSGILSITNERHATEFREGFRNGEARSSCSVRKMNVFVHTSSSGETWGRRPITPATNDGPTLQMRERILGIRYTCVTDKFHISKEKIGEGGSGEIRKCLEWKTGSVFACKTIHKFNLKTPRDVADLRTEVMLMGLLKVHSEVVQVHEVFEDRKAVHLVMELCKGGDLFDFIQSAPKGRLNDRHAASVMRQLLGALHHCHSLGVLHRDVKPENILLCDRMPHQTSNGEVGIKLSDFGVAGFLNDDGVCTDSAGTSEYMAPEMAMKAPYNAKADVWSAGVVLYAMLAGGLPSWAALPDEFNKQAGSTGGGSRRGKGKTMQEGIAWNELCLNRGVWRGVSEEAKDLLRALLRKDPEGRPSALEALGECGAVGHWVSAVRRY